MASTTATPAAASSVRLPSISELTSRSPISEETPISLRSKEVQSLKSASIAFKHPMKPSNANYVTHGPLEQSVPQLPYLYYDKPAQQGPLSVLQLPQPQAQSQPQPPQPQPTPQPQQISSTSSSPGLHHQYYPYHQTPVVANKGIAPPVPQPVPGSVMSYTTSPTTYYHQHMYYPPRTHAAPGVGPYAMSLPEVINKPTNKCHRCGTTETPEWRRGPNGVRTLCNACGLFHAKLVKRKGAALAAEEVLNNKVCKGKNGRRISLKKHLLNESLLKSNSAKPQIQGYRPALANALPLPPPMYATQQPPQPEAYSHMPPHNGGYSAQMPISLVRH